MRLILSLLFGFWVLFTFSGCGDMIRTLRRDSIDVEREIEQDSDYKRAQSAAPYQYKTLRGLSANNVKEVDPGVRRLYGEAGERLDPLLPGKGPSPTALLSKELRRAKRADFVDKDPGENSLWDSNGQGNYLFAQNRRRDLGELVTVQVDKDLKREIQYQLWLTLPPDQRRAKKANASDTVRSVASAPGATDPAKGNTTESADSKTADAAANQAAEEAAKANMPKSVPEDDFVRMEVAQNMENGLVKLTGLKRVVYRGSPRMVEITSIVNNKDIDDANKVSSGSFLDMQTRVVQ